METLAGSLAILVISALIVDWVLKSERDLRIGFRTSVGKVSALSSAEVLYKLTIWFSNLFDAIYGKRTWSWRRFWRSAVLSGFFVLFAILIIGVDDSYIGHSYDAVESAGITLVFLSVNVVIDFVSLQETRWVIGQVKQKRGKVSFVLWIGVDLLLTAAIYFLLFGAVLFVGMSVSVGIAEATSIVIDEEFVAVFLTPHQALPFFVSTFGTSIVWYLFVLLALAVRLLGARSRLLKVALQVLFESEAPGRIVAVIVGIGLVAVFGASKLFLRFL
ncbi:MAG: hypothetical protein OXG16_09015 [Rhodospirillales bacterium]|nr:hypothetical protein [Rhodospirillales bacterium]